MVELIVTMAVIGVLLALAVPAVTRSRQASRRIQCLSNVRQVGFGLLQATDSAGRFPACGNYGYNPATGSGRSHHSWVVDVLPWVEQRGIYDQWDKDKPIGDPGNAALARQFVPVITCPSDISLTREGADRGDLSFVVNGGVGFTAEYGKGVHDCPMTPSGPRLDFNANGVLCPQPPDLETDGDPSDRKLFFEMGLFFNETWKWDVTVRHHRPATVVDGMSQTFLITENARTGRNPERPGSTWATPNPYVTSFYIGNPCPSGTCGPGAVDYSLCNSGESAINAGLLQPEGRSPYPNSFHDGGVNMVFCDGRATFLSEQIDGRTYAALASPAGLLLNGTALEQAVTGGAGL